MFYVEENQICMKLAIVYCCRAICWLKPLSQKCKFERIYIHDGLTNREFFRTFNQSKNGEKFFADLTANVTEKY